MDPQQQREILFRFIDTLPQAALDHLSQKNLDVVVLTHDIGAAYEFVLYEMGNICEGVRRVLAGEDSASNFVAFIQKDERIEEDNRSKIPALAYEIQQKIFDPVLPILKQAGFPIKDGRVQVPPTTNYQLPTTGGAAAKERMSAAQPTTSTPSSVSVPRSVPSQFSVPLDERNIRALTRIAAGTEYGEEKLRETFEELPPGLRQSLSSVDTANAIQGIAKKYLLHVDQMASLASETGLVLLGLTHLADFVANLAKRLRLPEAEAREIARDISAEIFVKVRDSLRVLHEKPENSKSQSASWRTNSKQIPSSNIQNQPDLEKLSAISYKPKTGLATPFSPQAKWDTGANRNTEYGIRDTKDDNILARQARLKESLTREEVLRGIENPRMNQPPTTHYQQPTTQERMNAAGPTGWKPVGPASSFQVSGVSQTKSAPPLAASSQQLAAFPKTRPQSESAFPPPQPKPETDDFLDQKLQRPMTAPREERRYTIDPYREPID